MKPGRLHENWNGRTGFYNLGWAAADDVRRLEIEQWERREALRFPALRSYVGLGCRPDIWLGLL